MTTYSSSRNGQHRMTLTMVICVLSICTEVVAQHHGGHSHGFGGGNVGGIHYGGYGGIGNYNAYNGPYQYNYGGFNANMPLGGFNANMPLGGFNANMPLGGFNANMPLGGVSYGNAFGTATYSSKNFGVATFGHSRGGYNYYPGYVSPMIWSTPIYNYSPSIFGYGSGIFSPGFPAGTYVSNSYGLVPYGGYNFGGYPGWPYAVGLNSYFPGSGIAPTVLMLNMNLNTQPAMNTQPMQPMQPSAGFQPLLDPRLIDQVAPAVNPIPADANGAEVPPVPQPPVPGDQPAVPDGPQLPAQTDGVPILNEFQPVPREQRVSSLEEKIHSLRYQASGDDAFHKSDYATADVFYATAIKTAPDRRAPYLRMAMLRIAVADFPDAVSYLKTGLTMESDASRPWFTAEELYGQKVAERARSHGVPLWNWLGERPLSADRLLLAGTFQKMRGYNETADKMLALANHDGSEAMLVAEVMRLAAADTGQRAASHDVARTVEHASALKKPAATSKNESAEKLAIERAGGIFMRGKPDAVPQGKSVSPPKAEDLTPGSDAGQAPAPLVIPPPVGN